MLALNGQSGTRPIGVLKRKSRTVGVVELHTALKLAKRRKARHVEAAAVQCESKPTQRPVLGKLSPEAFTRSFRSPVSNQNLLAEPDLQKILNTSSETELKDLLNCLLLSECAYKIVDMSQRAATRKVQRVKKTFPPGMITIDSVQWSLPNVHHRYMLAMDKDTLYVSFMGTKQRRDLAANAAVLQEPLWPDMTDRQVMPAAHRGFLARAKAVPIESLYVHACLLGKRLVLTGHSLGGSVAQLSCLKLLRQLPRSSEISVRCVTFACPAVGNAALKEYAVEQGWTHLFQNHLIPEDLVPRLLASPEQSAEEVVDATIDALQPEEAKHIEEASIEPTLQMFNDIYDVVLNDDPYQVPLSFTARPPTPSRTQSRETQIAGHVSEPAAKQEDLKRRALAKLFPRFKGGRDGAISSESASSNADDSSYGGELGGPVVAAISRDTQSTQLLEPTTDKKPFNFRPSSSPQLGRLALSAKGSARATGQRFRSLRSTSKMTEGWGLSQGKAESGSDISGSEPLQGSQTLPMDSEKGAKTDKEKAVEAANLFKDIELLPGPEDLDEGTRSSKDQALTSEPANGTEQVQSASGTVFSASREGRDALGFIDDAILEDDDAYAESSGVAASSSLGMPSAQFLQERQSGGSQLLSPAGRKRRNRGRQTLSPEQDVFFPWSSQPLPSFARRAAARVIQSAGRLKGRRLPWRSVPSQPSGAPGGRPDDGDRSLNNNSGNTNVPSPLLQFKEKLGKPTSTDSESDHVQSSPLADGTQASTQEASEVLHQRQKDLRAGSSQGDAPELSARSQGSTVLPANSIRQSAEIGLEERRSSEAIEDQETYLDIYNSSSGWKQKLPISKLSAGVNKAASGAAKSAAKFVNVSIRAAQRRYAVLGRQAFLGPTGVVPATGVDSEQSFQNGLRGATNSSIVSALVSRPDTNVSANTIVSLQLPIAAARRRQPFLMHKMAFHRARILSLLECTLANLGISPYQNDVSSSADVQLSDALAPILQPARAEVFLPYSLPDDSDVRSMLDDLGSLSSSPPTASAAEQPAAGKRFKWLNPWRWISGLGWGQSQKRGMIELTAQVRGKGLENVTRIQVKESETGEMYQAEVTYKPLVMSPEETYTNLGLHRRGIFRQAALLRLKAQDTLSKVTSVIDRTNAMRMPTCLLVKLYLPLEAMTKLESRLLEQSNDDSGLTLTLMTDFRKVQIPLSVHGGGSWVISDLKSSSQFLDDWINHNVSG